MKRICLLIACCWFTAASAQQITSVKMADVVKRFSQKSDTLYIINFWATFCKPCIGEIPYFIKEVKDRNNPKIKLLLVSLDLPSFYPKKIADFVTQNHYDAEIAWLDENNADVFCPMIDKRWMGTIPATLFVNAKTGSKKFVEGEMNEESFNKELAQIRTPQEHKNETYSFVSPIANASIDDGYLISVGDLQLPKECITFNGTDSAVYSIAGGRVDVVAEIEDMKVIIIVNNNQYYTYSKLQNVFVKKGDVVKGEQLIGIAAYDLDHAYRSLDLYFDKVDHHIHLRSYNFRPRYKDCINQNIVAR